ncbi:T9SS type A sorting domain-containing protein, partial [Calditrichota bacterium]
DYFEAGDVITATLILTDDDDVQLYVNEAEENGLRILELWISGPRHNFHSMNPYVAYTIIDEGDGYDPDAGFEPETGEIDITLPDAVDWGGTATVQFKVKRLVDTDLDIIHPRADFQLNQVRPTFTKSLRYLSCSHCHDNISHHGTSSLDDCVVCHTHNAEIAMNAHFHNIHHAARQNTCHNCHRANGGLDRYGRTSCYSCHTMPNGHTGYTDSQCAHCHSGNNSVFNRHDEYTPGAPDNFDLIDPADDAILEELSVEMSWEESADDDNNDVLWYEVELALDEDFENVRIIDVEDNTSLDLNELVDGTEYWWRVRAADLNTDGRYSETRSFEVIMNHPEPPTAFHLVYPENGSGFWTYTDDPVMEHTWSKSVDPNAGEEVNYNVNFILSEFEYPDTILSYMTYTDTFLVLSLVDTVAGIQFGSGLGFYVLWYVQAVSTGDTVACDTPFTYDWITNYKVDESSLIPIEYSISEPYPNPFNAQVKLTVGLPAKGEIDIRIYNITGQLTGTISSGIYQAGYHEFLFNGSHLASGIYFISYSLNESNKGSTKIVLIK